MKSTKPIGCQRHTIRATKKEHAPFQTGILNELQELEQLEQLNALEDTNSRNQFLSKYNWTDSTLQLDAKQAAEDLLVEFHDISARHRFYNGINTDFKVQLTPLDNRPAYSQSLPAPINLKDDIPRGTSPTTQI